MNIVIFGKGGHSGVVAQAASASGHFIVDFIDESDYQFPKIGTPNQAAFIAIGNNEARKRLSKMDFMWVNIAHPTAILPKMDFTGSFFGANSFVGNNSKVGNFSIINTNSLLEHDSTLGEFSHLCPGVITGGRVSIGSRTTIGLNSTIRDGISIGSNCIIGMGSIVTKSIPDNSIAWGNPCRIKKNNG